MIVDLILVTTFGAVFYGGFKVGNKFKTVKDALSAAAEFVTK